MTNGPRIGSLFTGYGGLDLATEATFGGRTAWVSDVDDGANKIIAHRFPDTPNLGDITRIDWHNVEPVDILTGGFPCQDLSHAGKRAGLHDGTRSGLWVQMARAVDILRPSLVIAENVRGLLSATATASDLEPCPWCLGDTGNRGPSMRALGTVLADLAELGYDAKWFGLRAADVGAPHGRFRVFIVAYPQGDQGRVGDRDGATGDAEGPAWRNQEQSSISEGPGPAAEPREPAGEAGPWDEPCATCADPVGFHDDGGFCAGACGGHCTDPQWGRPVPDPEGDGWDEGWPEPAGIVGGPDAPLSGSSATPDADGDVRGQADGARRPRGVGEVEGRPGVAGGGDRAGEPADRDEEPLPGGGGGGRHIRDTEGLSERHGIVGEPGRGGSPEGSPRGPGSPTPDARRLPRDPGGGDGPPGSEGSGPLGKPGRRDRTPTSDADTVHPREHRNTRGVADQASRRPGEDGDTTRPSPSSGPTISGGRTPAVSGREGTDPLDGPGGGGGTSGGTAPTIEWGPYAAAVAGWGHVIGRPAPPPTEPGRKTGRPQLSPRFVEWMMGLPAGWVTDVPGLTRNAQLKALGNGVVPQQAAAALRLLLAGEPIRVGLGDWVADLPPTPKTTDAKGDGPSNHQRNSPGLVSLPALLPTPSVADSTGGHLTRGGDRSTELLLPGVAQNLATTATEGDNP